MRQASDAPRLFTNIVGNKISSQVYDPFGIELSAPGTNRLKFTGHERDLWDSVGGGDDLDYMHARFYLPLMGRFSSVDPIGGNPFAPQSWNRYSYVLGNPMNFIDPWGLTGQDFAATFHYWVYVSDTPGGVDVRRGGFGGLWQ